MNSNLLISSIKTLVIACVLTLLINKFSCICEGQSWWVSITLVQVMAWCHQVTSHYVSHSSTKYVAIWRHWATFSQHRLTCIGNPIVEIKQSWDRLIIIMGFPILISGHFYFKSVPGDSMAGVAECWNILWIQNISKYRPEAITYT